MAQFAPVCGPQFLKDLHATDSRNLFGTYHLLLAHNVAEQAEEHRDLWEYVNWCSSSKRSVTTPTIIMDNSIVELGGSVDSHMIKGAVELIKECCPSKVYPVLPDVMGDGQGTRELALDALNRWYNSPGSTHSMRRRSGDGCMLVAQGASLDDFITTVTHFFVKHAEKSKHIKFVGIPRVLTRLLGSRQKAVMVVNMIAPHVKIHLLGFSNNLVDDLLCARMNCVTGIDSAVPLRYKSLLEPNSIVGPREEGWLESSRLKDNPFAAQNILNIRKWVGW